MAVRPPSPGLALRSVTLPFGGEIALRLCGEPRSISVSRSLPLYPGVGFSFVFILSCGRKTQNIKYAIFTIFKCMVQLNIFTLLCIISLELSPLRLTLSSLSTFPLSVSMVLATLDSSDKWERSHAVFVFL